MAFTISKYLPDKLYGFIIDEAEQQVFFHLGAFRPGLMSGDSVKFPCGVCWPEVSPPPILGESVQVILAKQQREGQQAPKAIQVDRIISPTPFSGTVDTFDAARGFGFIRGSDGISYHLHKSEILDSRVPLPGQTVIFFAGVRQGKPRACHVKVCPHVK